MKTFVENVVTTSYKTRCNIKLYHKHCFLQLFANVNRNNFAIFQLGWYFSWKSGHICHINERIFGQAPLTWDFNKNQIIDENSNDAKTKCRHYCFYTTLKFLYSRLELMIYYNILLREQRNCKVYYLLFSVSILFNQ